MDAKQIGRLVYTGILGAILFGVVAFGLRQSLSLSASLVWATVGTALFLPAIYRISGSVFGVKKAVVPLPPSDSIRAPMTFQSTTTDNYERSYHAILAVAWLFMLFLLLLGLAKYYHAQVFLWEIIAYGPFSVAVVVASFLHTPGRGIGGPRVTRIRVVDDGLFVSVNEEDKETFLPKDSIRHIYAAKGTRTTRAVYSAYDLVIEYVPETANHPERIYIPAATAHSNGNFSVHGKPLNVWKDDQDRSWGDPRLARGLTDWLKNIV